MIQRDKVRGLGTKWFSKFISLPSLCHLRLLQWERKEGLVWVESPIWPHFQKWTLMIELQSHLFTSRLLGLCSEGHMLVQSLCEQSRQKAPPGIPSLPILRQMFYDSRVLERQSCFKYSYCNLHLKFLQSAFFFFFFCFGIPEIVTCPQTRLWNFLAHSVSKLRSVVFFFSPQTNQVHILRNNTWLPLTLVMFGVWCKPTFYPLNYFFFPKQ